MRRLGVAMVAVLAVAGLAACGSDDTPEQDTSTPSVLVFSDPATPIAVVPMQEFGIRVESNASTGYEWTITTPPDAALVEVITAEGNAQAPSTAEGVVGAPGSTTFEFKALASGTTEVVLTYARPFDPTDNPTTETFTINVS